MHSLLHSYPKPPKFPMDYPHSDHSDDYPAWLCHRKIANWKMEVLYGFIWFYMVLYGLIRSYMVLYGKYPLEMDVLYGFIWEYMGKSWEYMGIPSGNLVHNVHSY